MLEDIRLNVEMLYMSFLKYEWCIIVVYNLQLLFVKINIHLIAESQKRPILSIKVNVRWNY